MVSELGTIASEIHTLTNVIQQQDQQNAAYYQSQGGGSSDLFGTSSGVLGDISDVPAIVKDIALLFA